LIVALAGLARLSAWRRACHRASSQATGQFTLAEALARLGEARGSFKASLAIAESLQQLDGPLGLAAATGSSLSGIDKARDA